VFGLVGYLSLKRARAAKLVDDFDGQMKKSAQQRLQGQLQTMGGDAASSANAASSRSVADVQTI